jgi:hypothetical protein
MDKFLNQSEVTDDLSETTSVLGEQAKTCKSIKISKIISLSSLARNSEW